MKVPFFLSNKEARSTQRENLLSEGISGIYDTQKKVNLFQSCSPQSLQTSAYKDYDAQKRSSQNGVANNSCFQKDA